VGKVTIGDRLFLEEIGAKREVINLGQPSSRQLMNGYMAEFLLFSDCSAE
jgi:hypothetical protein